MIRTHSWGGRSCLHKGPAVPLCSMNTIGPAHKYGAAAFKTQRTPALSEGVIMLFHSLWSGGPTPLSIKITTTLALLRGLMNEGQPSAQCPFNAAPEAVSEDKLPCHRVTLIWCYWEQKKWKIPLIVFFFQLGFRFQQDLFLTNGRYTMFCQDYDMWYRLPLHYDASTISPRSRRCLD